MRITETTPEGIARQMNEYFESLEKPSELDEFDLAMIGDITGTDTVDEEAIISALNDINLKVNNMLENLRQR